MGRVAQACGRKNPTVAPNGLGAPVCPCEKMAFTAFVSPMLVNDRLLSNLPIRSLETGTWLVVDGRIAFKLG